LKKTKNVIEKTEDGKSVVRWLEEGTTGEGGTGWRHIY
jgi:hypothetical protein